MFAAPTPQLSAGPVVTYADGRAGAFQTIRLMRQLVRAYKVTPEMRQAATNLVFYTGPKDDIGEITAIFNFVRDGIRYTRDIHDVETISTPDKTLAQKLGDCDDKSTLFATLCEAVGYPVRFVLAGYHDDQFEHVYAQVFIYQLGEWIEADTTEDEPLGYAPPNPTVLFIENV